jgi:hypothetical protein
LLEGLIDEEKDMIFEKKLELFSIGTITISYEIVSLLSICRNSSLGLATKERVYKGMGQEGSPGVTSHALGSVENVKE